MKFIFICTAFFMLSHRLQAQKNITAEDYTKAVSKLGVNLNKLIDRNTVRPQWLPDGNFWYSVKTATGADYTLVNVKAGTKKTAAKKEDIVSIEKNVAPPDVRFTEVLSPDSKKAAFIKNWNLYVRDIATKSETQLTTDGEKDFGYATDNAGWTHSDKAVLLWSPDSKK